MNAEEREIQRTIWREQEAEEIEASKVRMSDRYGIGRSDKFDKYWKYAWDAYHSEGIDAVEQCFGELAELLK